MQAHVKTPSSRAARTATISVRSEHSTLTTRLVNYTHHGAQVVLPHNATLGQKVQFELSSRTAELSGYAQVTWTRRLRSGEFLASLRFLTLDRPEREAA